MQVVVRWAEMMCRRVRSVKRIRFTNSGTEAVMMAVRAARAFTGKDKILKMDWGYGGSYDPVIYPSDAVGVPRSAQADSLVIPYNDGQATEAAIAENKDRLAAVVVEGMMGAAGQIPPEEGYLKHLREVTAASGVLLILDEIQCFRLDCGGIQQLAGIEPDITTFGKIIGGGFPVGAFGGRAPVMELFAPDSQQVSHSGTLNANPVTATAGVATLEQLTAAEIARLNGLGELLADGIRRVFRDLGVRGQVTGRGSLQNIHFCPVPVKDGHTAKAMANQEIVPLLHLALMERGVFMGKTGLLDISTPMGESEIKQAVEAVAVALEDLLPAIRQTWPELTGG
jgi:glutamate-1-semialdehyde 2,1-aminomutase